MKFDYAQKAEGGKGAKIMFSCKENLYIRPAAPEKANTYQSVDQDFDPDLRYSVFYITMVYRTMKHCRVFH